jgi:hypothetical protein
VSVSIIARNNLIGVETLDLLVNDLEAHVALEAKAGNLIDLSVGAAVTLDQVDLLIKGNIT